jgi:hypothetical protein
MRRSSFALALGFFVVVSLSLFAQVESPEARAIRTQLEELQQRLRELQRQDGGSTKVTEIGSAASRLRPTDEPRLIVRIYDISDLYSIAPSYPAVEPDDLTESSRAIFPQAAITATANAGLGAGGFGGGMGGMGGGGGFFAVPDSVDRSEANRQATLHQAAGAFGGMPADSGRTSVDDLIETITTTIAPDGWDAVGGQASIRALGASLVISAPLETHEQIAALLDLFRQRWGSLRTVSIEAHWLWLQPAELSEVLNAAAEAEEPDPFGVLADDAWQRLRETSGNSGYHAALTCYNGQTVHTVAGGQRLLVAGMTPVVGGEEPAYAPQMRAVLEGAVLQITPVVTRTAKYVVADVHSRVNLLQGPASRLAPGDQMQTEIVAAIDRPVVQSQRLATTLRIPVGRPMLIGGMTFRQFAPEDPSLYLFLTTHVQELRDEEATVVAPDENARNEDVRPDAEPDRKQRRAKRRSQPRQPVE